MTVYIAYRDLEKHYFESTLCGGPPLNPDYRLASVKENIYVLTWNNKNYAVPKERAERFAEKVISGSTGKHRGFFPLVRELNGKKTAAVVEITSGTEQVYYDFDEAVLLQMLDSLRAESSELPGKRALINYTNPNPPLPEGDFGLNDIIHQIYFTPDNIPASVLQPVKPDTKTSSFIVRGDAAYVEVQEENGKLVYEVPAGLIPEIRSKVRELCKEPAEAYVENGSWEAFVNFGGKGDRIFIDPDKTLALLKNIASKSVLKEKGQPILLNCPVCGASRIEGRFCPECGAKLR